QNQLRRRALFGSLRFFLFHLFAGHDALGSGGILAARPLVARSLFFGFCNLVFVGIGFGSGILDDEAILALGAIDLTSDQIGVPNWNHRLTTRTLLFESRRGCHDRFSVRQDPMKSRKSIQNKRLTPS